MKEGDGGREREAGDAERGRWQNRKHEQESSEEDRDVRQQIEPIKHMGRFLQGVTDPCFLDRRTQVCPQ